MIEYKVANDEDLQGIVSLLRDWYFKESSYHDAFEFCEDATSTTVSEWIKNFCFIAKSGADVVGVASMSLMRSYYKQIEADIELFYIRPDFRGTEIARNLVKCCIENAKNNNAAGIYTGSLSNMDEKNQQLYVNLWKKHGFKVLGSVMFGALK